MQALDTIIWTSPLVRAARFKVSVNDPRFTDCGPTENYLVVFPRTSVWIRRPDARPFVADVSLATLYNSGQEYTRAPVHPVGDVCDWFGLSPQLALEIAADVDPRAHDVPDQPFRWSHAPVSKSVFLRQRRLFSQLQRGEIDQFEAEESIVGIVAAVFRAAAQTNTQSRRRRSQRELVEAAKCEINRHVTNRLRLTDLAKAVGVSEYHLCRVFREGTGQSLHQHQMELRLRLAVDHLSECAGDLSRLAVDLGFAHHSHFTSALRRRFGATPQELRSALRRHRAEEQGARELS